MTLLEKEINSRNIELSEASAEFIKRREYEQKFTITAPEAFEPYKKEAHAIEQIYLSHPDEEFSLRVRSEESSKGIEYTATLKDTGVIENGVRRRLEIETPITQEAFNYYAQSQDLPRISKRRATLEDGVTIDFIDGVAQPILEIETKDGLSAQALIEQFGDMVENRTDDHYYDTESIAHRLHGSESLAPKESLEAFSERVVEEMVARYASGQDQVVVGLSGMSGSGKSTVTRALQQTITESFGESFTPIAISTDDYHRGKKWLENTYGAPWTEWDDPRVYNTEQLAHDLDQLRHGEPLIRRHFDFESEETVYDEELPASPFILVEGLYAGSKDLDKVRQLHFELPTGKATSIGRDVRRIIIENRANRAFPTPESRLRYQIETALPLYESQERPGRNSFSASTRLLGERALMLDKLPTRL